MRHLLLLLSLLLVFGCNADKPADVIINLPTAPTAPEPDPTPVALTLAGRCGDGATSILCEDNSVSFPAGMIAEVTMAIRDGAGDIKATRTLPGGCATAPGLPCQIEFPGLTPDTYSVTHTVKPTDGGPLSTVVYRGLVVTGSTSAAARKWNESSNWGWVLATGQWR